jgi:Fic family protein
MRETGVYQTLGDLRYFIPHDLPPTNPPFELNAEIMALYGEASFALGKLNESNLRLPDPQRFIKAYVIKEALLSSAIEGIHTTLIEVFTHSLGESKPSKNTQLVLNYTKALDAALNLLRDENLPLVSRVILKAHEALMSSGEGDKAAPGLYRKQSVQVESLVPPPAQEIPRLMSALEKYINESSELPPLIKTGLVHVQFETIHPFLDGNGRIGRLLIVLMLLDNGLLSLPIIYPSYYFKKHHMEYYQKLDRVRTHGDFEGWITYYLKAIRDSALDAHARAKEIETLEATLKETIQTHTQFTKMRDMANLALNYLFTQPVTSITQMSEQLDKSYNTISNILKQFVALGFVAEDTIHRRNKLDRKSVV